jgi:ketosteroid isomerase-like protein
MKKYLPGFFIIFFVSCHSSPGVNIGREIEAMKNADIAFSDFSKANGMKAAFLRYIDSGAVLLRPGHFPIAGKNAQEYLQKINDSSFSLTWKPQSAELASSGDLGYTYGIYTFSDKDTSYEGTYVSIWKKQADGSWKFVLDNGNPGVDQKK